MKQESVQKISPIKCRILQFSEKLGISKREFYKTIGVSRGTLESKTGITEDILARFIAAYPNVSIEWLLTGKGDMERQGDIQLAGIEVSHNFSLRTDRDLDIQKIPLYEIDATAGLVSLFEDMHSNVPISYLEIPDLPPCDGAVSVRGDSMYPLLKSGDIVLYKQIHNFDIGILWGEMYLISFQIDGEEYLSIKYIQKGDDERHVRLVSHNPHHSPKDIPVDSIHALAIIKASVRYNTMG